MSLQYYIDEFSKIRLNASGEQKSPHKVCLLLSVMRMVEEEILETNRIYFNDQILQVFSEEFSKVQQPSDKNDASQPYFYLQSSSFWHHRVYANKQEEYNQRIAPGYRNHGGPNKIREMIEYAFVDDELFEYFKSPNARERLKSELLNKLDEDQRNNLLIPIKGWSWFECEDVVRDYFDMLEKELKGEKYNKTKHREALIKALNNRNDASVEMKHRNISAILQEMGLPIIDGYKPLPNYQRNILPDVIGAQLAQHTEITKVISEINKEPVSVPTVEDILKTLVPVPEAKEIKEQDSKVEYKAAMYKPRKQNFLEQEARNQSLGQAGEQFVINFEKARLIYEGRESLADRIEHISRVDDTAGFDIRSFGRDGQDRFVEVKTTNYDRYTRFFVSPNELEVSRQHEDKYHLYRVFNFKKSPQLFITQGAIDKQYHLNPASYMAVIG